jgi:hypothetical protein
VLLFYGKSEGNASQVLPEEVADLRNNSKKPTQMQKGSGPGNGGALS